MLCVRDRRSDILNYNNNKHNSELILIVTHIAIMQACQSASQPNGFDIIAIYLMPTGFVWDTGKKSHRQKLTHNDSNFKESNDKWKTIPISAIQMYFAETDMQIEHIFSCDTNEGSCNSGLLLANINIRFKTNAGCRNCMQIGGKTAVQVE